MSKIELLDCTLRDGGYVNNWLFGRSTINKIISKISKSSIEIVECGFLRSGANDKDKSLFNSVTSIKDHLPEECRNTMFVAMIAYGDISIGEISECDGTSITGIRLTFHENQIEEAFEFAKQLFGKGYKVFIQPVGTAFYTDKMLLDLLEKVNEFDPYAFYIVDTLGTMYSSDLLRMFYLIDNNLNQSIKLGFHTHNNLQLSFSNAQQLIEIDTKREIIIDSSIFGMGRGAGNLCTELITQYINENIEDRYNLLPVLEVMDEYIMPIYSKHKWGYSAPYYIAAINSCHPNYATYLMNLQTLCIRDISAVIKSIPDKSRHLYDEKLIEKLYVDYQQHYVDDSALINEITEYCKDRSILVLAPGKTLRTCKEKIDEFIKTNRPIVFAVNHVPENFDYDRIFISNMRRFKSIDEMEQICKSKMIITSNIRSDNTANCVNYSSYLNDDVLITDNSGLMLINILKKCGVVKIALAGYDGFNFSESENFYDSKMINKVDRAKCEEINRSTMRYFNKIKKSIDITFITTTLYEDNNEQI
ncbi:MAG: aldolase catalytic domain-containing protein [Porcipelethomonas sp.]